MFPLRWGDTLQGGGGGGGPFPAFSYSQMWRLPYTQVSLIYYSMYASLISVSSGVYEGICLGGGHKCAQKKFLGSPPWQQYAPL